MTAEKICAALISFGFAAEEDIAKYSSLVEANVKGFEKESYTPDEESRLLVYLATKTYYQICLTQQEEADSFKVGEVSVSSSASKGLERAKKLFDLAASDVADIIGFDDFAFMEV